jgi:ABC-2 type transport system ATP-binding protein
MDVIYTENLTKHFGEVHAVESLSLKIGQGEIYGFLGLNGAGKTTTIRLLLGMINPTEGSSFIHGEKVKYSNRKMWEKVGYMVEVPYSYPELTVRENLEIIRRLRFISEKDAVDRIMDQLKLTPYSERKARFLSQGNAQRLGLAKALIHKPDILLLDEPANALDPAGIVEIRKLLLELAEEGVTIFISSHILGEVSKFAHRIGIIHEGRLIREMDEKKLKELCRKRLVVSTNDNGKAATLLKKKGFPVRQDKLKQLEIDTEPAVEHPEEIATMLVKAGIPPFLLKVEEEDLESYFLRTIGMEGGAE